MRSTSGSGEPAVPGAATALRPFPIRRMAVILPSEYDSATVRQAIRRERAARRTRMRSRWWFPLVGALLALLGCWGLLKTDQVVADQLIWPTAGAQFIEVGPRPADPEQTGDRLVIVVAGLNRKDGSGVAEALMPSLAVQNTRVVSLIYGSGISDRDILDKFDGLISRFQPQQVSFFGSSMGGDVVLQLAAHTQDLRTGYVRNLLALPGTATPAATAKANSLVAESLLADSILADRGAQESQVADLSRAGVLVADPSRAGVQVADPSLAGVQAAGVPAAVAGAPALMAAAPAADSSTSDTTYPPGGAVDSVATAPPPPRLGTIFLDCSPLGANDVRDSSRTRADLLTAVMEATDTEGGAAVRMAAEVLGQQQQWSSGRFPFLQVRTDDLLFKINQVWQQKISAPGISTQLIKDQYGVIRRTDIEELAESFVPGTRLVYFLPESRHDDRTVRVERVEQTLRQLAADRAFDLRIVEIPGGQHASAESNSAAYRSAIDAANNDTT